MKKRYAAMVFVLFALGNLYGMKTENDSSEPDFVLKSLKISEKEIKNLEFSQDGRSQDVMRIYGDKLYDPRLLQVALCNEDPKETYHDNDTVAAVSLNFYGRSGFQLICKAGAGRRFKAVCFSENV